MEEKGLLRSTPVHILGMEGITWLNLKEYHPILYLIFIPASTRLKCGQKILFNIAKNSRRVTTLETTKDNLGWHKKLVPTTNLKNHQYTTF